MRRPAATAKLGDGKRVRVGARVVTISIYTHADMNTCIVVGIDKTGNGTILILDTPPDPRYPHHLSHPALRARLAAGTSEQEIDEMTDDGRLGALAKHLAIDAGADWPSLDGDAQDAWHEAAIRKLRGG